MRKLPYYDLVSGAYRFWESHTDITSEMREALVHGIRDLPNRRILGLPEMPPIPQDQSSLEYGESELRKGLQPEYSFFRVLTEADLRRVRSAGKLISSAFTVWQEKDGLEEPRFVICLNKQSTFFERRSIRMEGLPEFCTHVRKGDRMISFDVKAGYRHLRLHPDMLDDFVFCYNGVYYQCLAMPFGWGPAAYWFTRFMAPVIKKIRSWGYLVLVYIDDVLVIPRRRARYSGRRDCRAASHRIGELLLRLGITKHPEKGHWGAGVQRATHLGFYIDTVRMMFFVPDAKRRSTRKMARRLLREVRCGRRWVTVKYLSRFLGKTTALHLAVPLARFYNRELYVSLHRGQKSFKGKMRVRLCKQAIRDLKWWARLGTGGRPMHLPLPSVTLHSDAADTGWGGTIAWRGGLPPGSAGDVEYQGIWHRKEARRTILWRELRALYNTIVRCTRDLRGSSIYGRSSEVVVLCYQDNSACRYIVQNMCTASQECMPLLRRLQRLLDRQRIVLQMKWLPSVMNVHADRLSRTWDPRDIQMSRQALTLLKDIYGLRLGRPVFSYRTLRGHPMAHRKATLDSLNQDWGDGLCRLFNPPIDLISLVLFKIESDGARGVLVIPDWPNRIWYATAKRIARSWVRLPLPGTRALCGARSIRNYWRLVMIEVGPTTSRLGGL